MAAPITPAYRQRIGYHTGLLGMFALLASAALMMSYQATHKDIALRLNEDLKATLSKVVPASLHDNDMASDIVTIAAPNLISSDSPVEVYIARKDKQVVALAYELIAPEGYAGPITVMMGVNMQGEILGVRVITHAETPGLGDKIEAKKSSWILSFTGLSDNNTRPEEWKVKKDGGKFDQFTGATITPRAVVKAVRRGLDFFTQRKADILAKATAPQVNAS